MSSVQSSRYLTSKSILGDAFPKSGAQQQYSKSLSFGIASEAPYVKEISNCALVCMLLNAETGAVVNVATAHFKEAPAGVNDVLGANAPSASAAADGILLSADDATASIYDAQGRLVAATQVCGNVLVPTTATGLFLVAFEVNGVKHTVKVVR